MEAASKMALTKLHALKMCLRTPAVKWHLWIETFNGSDVIHVQRAEPSDEDVSTQPRLPLPERHTCLCSKGGYLYGVINACAFDRDQPLKFGS